MKYLIFPPPPSNKSQPIINIISQVKTAGSGTLISTSSSLLLAPAATGTNELTASARETLCHLLFAGSTESFLGVGGGFGFCFVFAGFFFKMKKD